MARMTIPDEDLPNGSVKLTLPDNLTLRERFMDFYWALKRYEDTGLEPSAFERLVFGAETPFEIASDAEIHRLKNENTLLIKKLAAEKKKKEVAFIIPCEFIDTCPSADGLCENSEAARLRCMPFVQISIKRLTAERDAEKKRADAADHKLEGIKQTLRNAYSSREKTSNYAELAVSYGLAIGNMMIMAGIGAPSCAESEE